MPLYEYRCPSCNDRFERLARFSDGLEADCPHCGSVSPRVLSTFAAFVSRFGRFHGLRGRRLCLRLWRLLRLCHDRLRVIAPVIHFLIGLASLDGNRHDMSTDG